jgi:hypothetical protein
MKIFGFEIFNKKKEDETFKPLSMNTVVSPDNDDGAVEFSHLESLASSHYFLLNNIPRQNEIDKIKQYREISSEPEVDQAIDEIVNEAIVLEDNFEVVRINLDDLEDYSEDFKEKISEEFDYILQLLNFNVDAYSIFRKWYVDGRLFYNKVIDFNNPKAGIQKLLLISPFHIRKIREIIKEVNENTVEVVKDINEFYIYDPVFNFTSNTALKLPMDSVIYVHSGLVDEENKIILSYLEKAIKAVNQLRQMEDASIIYRLARAPERRVIYVDVAGLPKIKAEQYIKNLMTKFKNRLSYDAITGKVKDSRNQLSMMEDIWIPRRTDGKTAEIQTLPGSTNTDQTEEVKYFLNKVYSALNVPVSRLNSDTPSGVSFGRTAEITRDELKFSKFIRRLQTQFSNLFYDVLRTQLLLKNIISINDWEDIKNGIKFEFEKDNYYTESKNAAVLKDQLDMMNTIDSMIGKYFSTDFAYKNIMGFNEEEINEEKRLMAVASGKAPEGGDEGAGGDLGFGGDGGADLGGDFGGGGEESMPPPEGGSEETKGGEESSAPPKEKSHGNELDFMKSDLKSMKSPNK